MFVCLRSLCWPLMQLWLCGCDCADLKADPVVQWQQRWIGYIYL